MPEIKNYNPQRANVEENVEKRSYREPKKMLSDPQMSGAGNRKPLS